MARQTTVAGPFGPLDLDETGSRQASVGGVDINETAQDAVVGTLTATLGAVTLSSTATATDTVTGTLNKTLGAVTLVSTATADVAVVVAPQPGQGPIGGSVDNRRKGGTRRRRGRGNHTVGDEFRRVIPYEKPAPATVETKEPAGALDYMRGDTAAGRDLAANVVRLEARKAKAEAARQFRNQQEAIFLLLAA